MDLYSVEAVALRGPWRVCMIATEISNTFLESSDIVLSLVPDQNWYLKVDQISPTLFLRITANFVFAENAKNIFVALNLFE